MSHANRDKKIGYVLRRFPVLSETFVLNEILALEANGMRLHIFSLAPPKDPRFHEGVPQLKASITYVPDILALKKLLQYNVRVAKHYGRDYFSALWYALKTGRPTFVWRFLQSGYVVEKAHKLGIKHFHAHFAARATSVASFVARITGVPYSFTAHAYDIYKNGKPKVLCERIENSKFVVTVSSYNKEYLQDIMNGSAHKIFIVRNGVDLVKFSPNKTRPPIPPFTLLTVGRLVEKKGCETLIEACGHLRDRGIPFRCWAIGKGPHRVRLQSLIGQRKLDGYVKLLGPRTQSEVLEHYHAAHLFVLPCVVCSDGNRDGLPVSIVEALACGLPVVTTPVTGIPEAVRHEHNGLHVPQGDSIALADALERLITDRDLFERLRANARRSVESMFDNRRTAKTLRNLLCRSGK